ncbi:hypothetical protein Glove_122g89 [Diversispora epigaea]|uniref:Protein kinase domain-containing protein n=1 Tax=Diversispora epigaea TaxID=1348612 RepID=A0A397J5D6_9GLOM|nr:hypothetical protein Glove_122g89 [Diversispora epigaea]
MSDNISFFCLVKDDPKKNAFEVEIEKNKTVSFLKEKIKEKLHPLFENIAAKDIVLWKVNVPFDDEAMEVDIVLENKEEIGVQELSRPTRKISNVFIEDITDDSIQIIIERPSAGQGNSPDVFSLINDLKSGQKELKVEIESGQKKLKFEIESGQRELKSEIESGQKELKSEMESGFRKVQNVMDATLYSPGMLTETDKGKEVQEKGTLIDFPLNVTTSTKSSGPGRFLNPPENEDEKALQNYFIKECISLEFFEPISKKLKLIVKDTHNSPLLGTRKPDFVFIPKDSYLDYLNVIAVGEIKKPASGNFRSADIGQAVSFGEKLLQLQPRRRFAFVILTDCIKINIYRVTRVNDHQNSITLFKYEYTTTQFLKNNNSNNNNGWKYLVTFMESTPYNLGWIEPSLKFGNETVNLVKSVGIGRTSIVYEGEYNNELVAVKMAKKVDYLPCFEREKSVLKELSALNSPHIPKILFENIDTLVMTPRGVKVNNLQEKDIKDIIITLKNVHSH